MFMGLSNGRPTLAVGSTQVGISTLSIKVHGPWSWLYNFVVDVLSGLIKKEVISGMEKGITNALNEGANKALQTIPIIEKVGPLAEVC